MCVSSIVLTRNKVTGKVHDREWNYLPSYYGMILYDVTDTAAGHSLHLHLSVYMTPGGARVADVV